MAKAKRKFSTNFLVHSMKKKILKDYFLLFSIKASYGQYAY